MINHYILNLLTESTKNTLKSEHALLRRITAESSCVYWHRQKKFPIPHCFSSIAFVMGDVSRVCCLS